MFGKNRRDNGRPFQTSNVNYILTRLNVGQPRIQAACLANRPEGNLRFLLTHRFLYTLMRLLLPDFRGRIGLRRRLHVSIGMQP